MAYAPLELALSQPTNSGGGSSKWARILGGGLAGASFLPGLANNPGVKNAMLTGALGMLGSGSYWGGLAGVPSLLGGLGNKSPLVKGSEPPTDEGQAFPAPFDGTVYTLTVTDVFLTHYRCDDGSRWFFYGMPYETSPWGITCRPARQQTQESEDDSGRATR